MTVVDVHTHMLNTEWLQRLVAHGGRYEVREVKGLRMVHMDGAPFMTLQDAMFDYEQRIRDMDVAKVDVAIISLTCPSVYWGGEEVSSDTARMMNDDMAAQQRTWPDRLRFFATLPWQHPQRAVKELDRAVKEGAVGVFVSANVTGESLTNEKFAPIWEAIDKKRLPVLVHPSAPPGTADMDMQRYNLIASVGFMFDTTLAVARMIYDGFFERYQRLKIIACHAGGAIPYLIGRLDFCYQNMPPMREVIQVPPSEFMEKIYFDTVTFTQGALDLCLKTAGHRNVLYGSDYPHNIGDMAGCLARVDALSSRSAAAVRGKNAERIFKL